MINDMMSKIICEKCLTDIESYEKMSFLYSLTSKEFILLSGKHTSPEASEAPLISISLFD